MGFLLCRTRWRLSDGELLMNPFEIINWTRKPPQDVWVFRITKAQNIGDAAHKLDKTFTRLRYAPATNTKDLVVNEMLEFLREKGFSHYTGFQKGSTGKEAFEHLMKMPKRKQELYDMYTLMPDGGIVGYMHNDGTGTLLHAGQKETSALSFKAIRHKIKSFN